jgi:uncharacterized repeat protein (TIGR01451 family)/uncharacterized delta-60 repeat protein
VALGLALTLSIARPAPVAAQAFDPAFAAAFQSDGSVSGGIHSMTVQVDGKIVICGGFVGVNGVPRSYLARLNADGSLDTGFTTGMTQGATILQVAALADGKVLVAGHFTQLAGVSKRSIARLNADGSLDNTFVGTVEGRIMAVLVQPDGKIIIGGQISQVNGNNSAVRLVRLNADGTLDAAFAPLPDGTVYTLARQSDGRILVGGGFASIGGVTRHNIARLNANGTADTTFVDAYPNDYVYAIAVRGDGKILIGGEFDFVGATQRIGLAQLSSTGVLDTTFDVPVTRESTPFHEVEDLIVQPDGKILVAGLFDAVGGVNTYPVARLLPTGAFDYTFGTAGNSNSFLIRDIELQPDGKVLVGGSIITRLLPIGPLPPSNANLQIAQSAVPEPVAPGGTLTYTLTVSNSGPDAAADVVVSDTLPDGVAFTNCSATVGGTCVGSGNARTITFDSLASGVSSTITLTTTVTAGAGATITNTASVTASVTDPDGTNNSATAISHTISTPPPPCPDDPDCDTLLTEWEEQYGLNPLSAVGDDGAAGDPDHDGRLNVQEQAEDTSPVATYTRYLAEGATNSFFHVRLALLNVGTKEAHILLRYLQTGGGTVTETVKLIPGKRLTYTDANFANFTSSNFSTIVESDQPIVVDRTMSWDASGYGSHAETAVDSPSTTWYLAEGSTSGDFALFYLLQNPNAAATTATIRYLLPFDTPVVKTYELPPLSRTTIAVDEEGGLLASTDVAAEITAASPIIVERAMYKSTGAQVFAAGHGSAGVTRASQTWFLAEGATGPFFDCFLLLANPNPTPANVSIDYLLSAGTTRTKSYVVPASARITIWVDAEEIPEGSGQHPLDNVAVSSAVTADIPIIVERTMWWPGPAVTPNFWSEAHNSPGATVTGTRWALAEGEVGGDQVSETYLLIANTSPVAGTARVTLYFEDGTSAANTFSLDPRSRRTVSVSSDFPGVAFTPGHQRFGSLIESLGTTPAQIVVERAMYTSSRGVTWAAGTNALATPLPPD